MTGGDTTSGRRRTSGNGGWVWLASVAVVLLQGLAPLLTGVHLEAELAPCWGRIGCPYGVPSSLDASLTLDEPANAVDDDEGADGESRPQRPTHRHHDESNCSTCQLLAIARLSHIGLAPIGDFGLAPCFERACAVEAGRLVFAGGGARTSRGPPRTDA